MLGFYANAMQQLESAEDCLKKGRVLSSLCLLYSLMDVTASLERRSGEGTKSAFVRWVDENMLKGRSSPYSALDLYGARCGVLHSFTPDSDLSREGQARKVIYAWGTARAEDLAETARNIGRDEIAVHIVDLMDCFRRGLETYLDGVMHSPERLKQAERNAELWFTKMDRRVVDDFLRLCGS